MNYTKIRRAKAALLEKSILGYRKSGNGSERTSEAKVGVDKAKGPSGERLARVTDAKVGVFKSPEATGDRLVRSTDAKVGTIKIQP